MYSVRPLLPSAVAMDMSSSYSHAVTEHLPHVDIVFDRYHIMAQMNMAIESLRRQQQNVPGQNGQKILKGCRFLLLRNYQSLTPDRQVKLDTLLEINKPLFTIHSMKEQLNHKRATEFLDQWCFDALGAGPKPLIKVGLIYPASVSQVAG